MRRRSWIVDWLYGLKRRMYRGDRPGLLARVMNRASAVQFAAGMAPGSWVTLEVVGRRSGRPITFPVVLADVDEQRYVVSMLGEDANWVQNVRAAGGRAAVHHRGRRPVQLEEVAVPDRAPILRRYLAVAPGARPHMPVDRTAPLEDFERVAHRYPVFRILPRVTRDSGR